MLAERKKRGRAFFAIIFILIFQTVAISTKCVAQPIEAEGYWEVNHSWKNLLLGEQKEQSLWRISRNKKHDGEYDIFVSTEDIAFERVPLINDKLIKIYKGASENWSFELEVVVNRNSIDGYFKRGRTTKRVEGKVLPAIVDARRKIQEQANTISSNATKLAEKDREIKRLLSIESQLKRTSEELNVANAIIISKDASIKLKQGIIDRSIANGEKLEGQLKIESERLNAANAIIIKKDATIKLKQGKIDRSITNSKVLEDQLKELRKNSAGLANAVESLKKRLPKIEPLAQQDPTHKTVKATELKSLRSSGEEMKTIELGTGEEVTELASVEGDSMLVISRSGVVGYANRAAFIEVKTPPPPPPENKIVIHFPELSGDQLRISNSGWVRIYGQIGASKIPSTIRVNESDIDVGSHGEFVIDIWIEAKTTPVAITAQIDEDLVLDRNFRIVR